MSRLARIPLPSSARVPAPVPPRYYAEGPPRDATPEQINTELTRLAFANVADIISVAPDGRPIIDLSATSREALASIASISSTTRTTYAPDGRVVAVDTTTRVQLADKLKALELQGRTLGMFKPVELHVTLDLADRLLAARERLRHVDSPASP